jgi:hypothetical protein
VESLAVYGSTVDGSSNEPKKLRLSGHLTSRTPRKVASLDISCGEKLAEPARADIHKKIRGL